MGAASPSDDLWLGVKSSSNSVIAGSPRNHFRVGLLVRTQGGRALVGLGASRGVTKPCQTSNTLGNPVELHRGG